jgi:anti-anti-sigma regulatory factor
MASASADACSVKLEGEWVMDQAADLKTLLTQTLAELGKSAPGADGAVIDMSAVTGLDACCCQLLAVFLEDMRRRGITPVPSGIPEELRDRIAQLGFSELLAATVPLRDESA